MYGTSMCENREIPLSPRLLITGWAAQGTQGGTPEMHERGKSDRFVVPANPPNKATAAEVGEERERAKGNTVSKTHPGPSAGTDASSALGRVREVPRRDKDARLTALLPHVTASRLRRAYWAISPKAAQGLDWVTWDDYGRNLEANLLDLHGRVQSGRYRAKPSRRAYIPKPDGRLRPLGIASLEDKIVQRAVVEVLNAVYEVDFRGFSYGFRPGRGPHDALDALAVGIERKRVNWVLDADIRNFFGQIDHSWLRRFVEHRIADKRIWRLIGKWLAAGVIEDGQWSACEEGSPQGASVTAPTQWAMFGIVTLCVAAVGVVAGAVDTFSDGDAVSDGDLLRADENVLDEQLQHALAFFDGGDLGVGVQLGEEAFEVGGELEVGPAVGELVV